MTRSDRASSMTELPADVLIEVRRVGSWKIIVASYRGLAHIEGGDVRQDAFRIEIQSSQDSTFCICVADGLSAAAASEVGAKYVCRVTCTHHAQMPYLLRSTAGAKVLFETVRLGLESFSEQVNLSVDDLATTLQFFSFAGRDGHYLGLGDGGAVVLSGGQGRWLGKPRHQDIIGVSNLSDPKSSAFLATDEVDLANAGAVFLFSDGVEQFFIRNVNDGMVDVHHENVRRFHELGSDENLESMIAKINKIMGGDQGKDMRDDKTLIIAIRTAEAPVSVSRVRSDISQRHRGIEVSSSQTQEVQPLIPSSRKSDWNLSFVIIFLIALAVLALAGILPYCTIFDFSDLPDFSPVIEPASGISIPRR